MRFEDITHSPKERLKTVLATLNKEFKIALDFKDITGLKKLESIALESIEKNKDKSVSVFEEKSTALTINYLILEAIKLKEELDMKKINEASEIEKAEYLLASKNIVDDLQGMIEDISKIQAEKISSITDRIKIEQGLDAAENYKSTATSLMTSLMSSLSATKDGLDNLTLSLSGDVSMAQAPMAAPAVDAATPPAMPDADEEPAPEAEEEPKKMANPLGRERKEESTKKTGKVLAENAVGLDCFHVTVKSPDGKKLFGNYKVRAKEAGLAVKAAKEQVMNKHGMSEWRDEYMLNCVKVPTPKDNATKSPATPTTKQVDNHVDEKLGDGKAFKKIEKSAAKHGAKNPAAVAAAAGIKKYGVKKMEKMAHAHESVDEPNTFDDQEIDESSRKHFQATADMVKSMKDPEERKKFANHHAEIFKTQNPRFDHGHFMSACGVNEDFEKEYDDMGNTILKQKPLKKK